MSEEGPSLADEPLVGGAHLTRLVGPWSMKADYFAAFWQEVSEADFDEIPSGLSAEAEAQEVEAAPTTVMNDVAEIQIRGGITKHPTFRSGTSALQTRQALREAAQDPDVGAILLHIDSPGGQVAGVGDLADDIARINEEKPVFAYIEDLGASAGYWIASQADQVFASRHAEIGSIGVFAQVFDISEALEEFGVRPVIAKTGERKGDFAPGVEIDEDMEAELQRQVEMVFELFVDAVARGRGLTEARVRDIADGRVHLAEKAERMGLIDKVTTIDDARALAREAAARQPNRSVTLGASDPYTDIDVTASETGEEKVSVTDPDGETVQVRAEKDEDDEGVWSLSVADTSATGDFSELDVGDTVNLQVSFPSQGGGSASTEPQSEAATSSPPRPSTKVPDNPPNGDGEGVEGEWDAPVLSDFTDEKWADLSEEEKESIARYYADAADEFTDDFDADLNLPHHFYEGSGQEDGKPSLNGVRNALSRLPQTDAHSDSDEIESHLNEHLPEDEEGAWQAYLAGEMGISEVLARIGADYNQLGLTHEQISSIHEAQLDQTLESEDSEQDGTARETDSEPLSDHPRKNSKREPNHDAGAAMSDEGTTGLDLDAESDEVLHALYEKGAISEEDLAEAGALEEAEVEELEGNAPAEDADPEADDSGDPEVREDNEEMEVSREDLLRAIEQQNERIEALEESEETRAERREREREEERQALAAEIAATWGEDEDELLETYETKAQLKRYKEGLQRNNAQPETKDVREQEEEADIPNVFEEADEHHKQQANKTGVVGGLPAGANLGVS